MTIPTSYQNIYCLKKAGIISSSNSNFASAIIKVLKKEDPS